MQGEFISTILSIKNTKEKEWVDEEEKEVSLVAGNSANTTNVKFCSQGANKEEQTFKQLPIDQRGANNEGRICKLSSTNLFFW